MLARVLSGRRTRRRRVAPMRVVEARSTMETVHRVVAWWGPVQSR
jgi:hypothetical protein